MSRDDEKFLRLMGEKIRDMRKKSGYSSQDSFAYDANIPRAQYARYEKGQNLTMLSLRKILKYHKVSLSEFFKGIE